MKRNERSIYNEIRKLSTDGLLNVEIPVSFSDEAKQKIHETLTVLKNMVATKICYNSYYESYTIHYIPCNGNVERNKNRIDQESKSISEIIEKLPVDHYSWNGYIDPVYTTEETEETEEEPEPLTMRETINDIISDYLSADEAEKEAKKRKEEAKEKIVNHAGNAEGFNTDIYSVVVKKTDSCRLNTKELMKDFPDIKKEYGYISTSVSLAIADTTKAAGKTA